ncbi:stage III sporulation protein AF [Aquibacillus salsiterrae]|uniref:Stage III sporulation protein AF n=1 Tax=Aquibacillus salsiterrae TaxID=2950439 RepID=A0A9X3WDK8_9BACI|nr:stage III sporulation protein AF [Aquibacillus salsiterrae]MDC3415489.1 stage III sporulation protein AF [Aquibacillus salsiterrae]
MGFLIDWVTQIILFLLLAMIIDLLLPNSSMKKYINMVVGLLLILIFLQPLFQLFQIDVQEIVSEVTPALDTSIDEKNMKNSIELQKNEIQAQQDAYILEEMAVQMKNDVKEGLREDYDVQITNISFTFSEGNEMSLDSLEEIDVNLVDYTEEEKRGVVEEVVIDVSGEENAEENSETNPETEKIKKYLYDMWQLDDQKINLRWEGGV